MASTDVRGDAESMASALWLLAHSGSYTENHRLLLEEAALVIRRLLAELDSDG